MKKNLTCALLFSTVALFEDAEANTSKYKTTWSKKRVSATKYRLERNFGKGLNGLLNSDGHVDPDRLGWLANKHNGGKPLGASIT